MRHYPAQLRAALEALTDEQLWWRPNDAANAVGNLVLHVCGSTRHFLGRGVGGTDYVRDRPAEFAAQGGVPAAQLMRMLSDVVDAACACVDRQTVDELLAVRTIQQRYRESGLQAVLHVLEHFSGHAGQIYFWTKQVTGQDLKFYDL